jgi:acetylornithine deacetylase/succinyl-diaminopimelate desuccinylase-like protein
MKKTAALLPLLAFSLFAAEAPDLTMQTRIRQEGLRNSKVMEIAETLMDDVGPRLTGSPNMKRANEWTRDKLTEFGLSNAHLEEWGPFGRGWSYDSCSLRMVSPDIAQLIAVPRAWTPGTNGPTRGKVLHATIATKEDLDKIKGKIAGKFLLIGDVREFKPHEQAQFERYDDKSLAGVSQYEMPRAQAFNREAAVKRRQLFLETLKLFADEKPLGVIVPGGSDFGTIHVQSAGSQRPNEQYPVPSVVVSDEQYARIVRLLDNKKEPELELDVKAKYYDDNPNQYNTVAEIPGTAKNGEVVMLGAHLDSWHSGTGATDNGAGTVAVMEAVRILKAIGIAPKRTIRIALWSGEEEGLLGSHAYVAQHFGSKPLLDPSEASLPMSMQKRGPLTIKPEQAKLSAYFNLDNGTGKVRGVYTQENAAAVPIFQAWLEPMKDLGATAITMRNTGGTDHLSFDEVGIPGFQFIQDDIEYEQRTHHTNFDVYERLQRDDLMQAAVVIATFVWEAANRSEMFPRKPLPKEEPPKPQPAAPGQH